MKVAIATDDFKNVTGHVGRCEGFLIVEVEDGKVLNTEERINDFTNHGRGGHGHGRGHGHGNHGEEHRNGHQRLADGLSDCSHLIAHGMGWRLVEDFTKANIKPIITNEVDAVEAAKKLENGTLEILEDAECRSH
ncbi:MAG: NifB/NifX family molybdenum-iron cluster-binding protein [Melioribacteraceae bacterium]|nr:NifB/NifX family molybdenum-iron cluster-binding protein [Melioribacteraceae bacterium]